MLVGHEPTWSALATLLVGGGRLRLPTAGLAHVAFDCDDWAEVGPGAGVLYALVTPALLRGTGDRRRRCRHVTTRLRRGGPPCLSARVIGCLRKWFRLEPTQSSSSAEINLEDPGLYINRELSWLRFNERVLEEALDPANPLLERVNFLTIFYSNLDEFFMVRVSGLLQQRKAGVHRAAAGRHVAGRAAPDHPRAPAADAAASRRLLDGRPPARSGQERHPRRRPPRARRRAAGRVAPPFRGRAVPGPHAARLRPRPSVPAHLQSQHQPGGGGARPRRRREVRSTQGAGELPAPAAGGGRGERRRLPRARRCRERRRRARPRWSGSRRWSPPTSTGCSPVSRSSTPIRSASRATPTSRSKRTRPTISSPRWRRWWGAATSAWPSGSRSTARCRGASATS